MCCNLRRDTLIAIFRDIFKFILKYLQNMSFLSKYPPFCCYISGVWNKVLAIFNFNIDIWNFILDIISSILNIKTAITDIFKSIINVWNLFLDKWNPITNIVNFNKQTIRGRKFQLSLTFCSNAWLIDLKKTEISLTLYDIQFVSKM